MVVISRNLMSYSAVMPRWFVVLLIVGGILAGASMLILEDKGVSIPSVSAPKMIEESLPENGRGPASVELEAEASQDPVVFFGIAFCSAAAVISFLVLLISLPVFLFSSNAERVSRAGGLVKTTLGFFVGSAGAIIATISFAPM